MLAYQYTIKNKFNGEQITINAALDSDLACKTATGSPTGVRLTTYPRWELDVRNEEEDRTGQHGIWDFFSFYGKRVIRFEGLIIAQNHAELVAIENRMRAIFNLPAQPIEGIDDGYVCMTWTDALGVEWTIDVKKQNDLTFRRDVGVKTEAQFFLEMKSDNPYILTTELFEEQGLKGYRGGSMTLPTFLPVGINTNYNNVLSIYMDGTAASPARYRLYGPAINPRITRLREVFSNEQLISNFSSGWVGGTPNTDRFQTGGVSQQLTSNGAPSAMQLTTPLDLTNGFYVNFYYFVENKDNINPTGANYIRFYETPTDYFEISVATVDSDIQEGWNYFFFPRNQFEITGAPSWNNITEVEFSIESLPATELKVSFDELYVRDMTPEEDRLQVNITLGDTEWVEFDVLAGTVTKNNGADVSGFVTTDSTFFALNPKQNLLIYEDDTNLGCGSPTELVEVFWNNAQL